MNTIECANVIQPAVNKLGSGFMLDGASFARAPEVGLEPGFGFYVLGRFGALGNATPEVVASVASFMAPAMVGGLWSQAAATADPRATGLLFFDCAAMWGRAHLAEVAGLVRLNELAAKVVDNASPLGAPLVAALAALPRAEDAPARCVQLAFAMRELRMARHAMAVFAGGMTPLEAILSGEGGEANAKMFGWQPPFADAGGLADQRAAVEAQTHTLHGIDLAVLSDAERAELAAGYGAAFAAVS